MHLFRRVFSVFLGKSSALSVFLIYIYIYFFTSANRLISVDIMTIFRSGFETLLVAT